MSRYQIFARRQVANAGRDLTSIARMDGITVISRTKKSLVADMPAPVASSLARKYGATIAIEARG